MIRRTVSMTRASRRTVTLFAESVSAGFPSPAEDYVEDGLDLNSYLVRHPSATFFVRASGDSMLGAGIHDGDILIVDRSLDALDKSVVIAVVDGELTVKRLRRSNDAVLLVADNENYKPIVIDGEQSLVVWGVVTSVIHSLR